MKIVIAWLLEHPHPMPFEQSEYETSMRRSRKHHANDVNNITLQVWRRHRIPRLLNIVTNFFNQPKTASFSQKELSEKYKIAMMH